MSGNTRQRRLEAIARRRAFIDNQIQMLSSTEIRVPNIIRSRSGRAPLPKSRLSSIHGPQLIQQTVVQQTESLSTSKELLTNTKSDSSGVASSTLKLGDSDSTEKIYVTVLNESDGEGHTTFRIESTGDSGENNESFPVAFSSEIAKMLSGVTEQSIQSFETIQTDDGTVMVVLEGSNFTENETVGLNVASSEEGESSEVPAPSTPATTPSTSSMTAEVPKNVEEVPTTYEESYVILQTPEGDVLVPSSSLPELQQQTQSQLVSTDENIVQFIANESGTIEQFITHSNSSKLSNKAALPRNIHQPTAQNKTTIQRTCTTFRSSTSVTKRPVNVKSVNSESKNIKRLSHSKILYRQINPVAEDRSPKARNVLLKSSSSGNLVSAKVSSNISKEEKPRPYRFELPELEDRFTDMHDCFMSVPVPIQIGNLRSETKRVDKSEIKSTYLAVKTTSGKSSPGNLDMTNKSKDECQLSNQETGFKLSAEVSANPEMRACQQLTLEASLEENDTSNSIYQCGQCLEIFNTASSISKHLEHCNANPQNEITSVSTANEDVETESEVVNSTNLYLKENTSGINSEDLIIKSINSVRAPTPMEVTNPVISSNGLKKQKLEVSSPLNSTGHVDSSISMQDQPVSPLLLVGSSSFVAKNDDLVNIGVQLTGETNHLPFKVAKLDDISKTNVSLNFANGKNEVNTPAPEFGPGEFESLDVGRRTLFKASAKASMSNEAGEREEWELSKVVEPVDGNGNTITIQSARIRSRNDRIKAMDKSDKTEEELGFNFRNIFEQVVKQSIPFN